MKRLDFTTGDSAAQWCEPTPHRADLSDEQLERELTDDLRRAARYMDALASLGSAAGLPVTPGTFSYVTGREALP